MKENELMIGDWVCGLDNGEKYPGKVKELGGNVDIIIETIDQPDDFEPGDCFEEIEPILLTPEVLKKNGWAFDDIDCSWYDINMKPNEPVLPRLYGTGKNLPMLMFDGRVAVWYVHELQHSLKLCGIEKDIIV